MTPALVLIATLGGLGLQTPALSGTWIEIQELRLPACLGQGRQLSSFSDPALRGATRLAGRVVEISVKGQTLRDLGFVAVPAIAKLPRGGD